MPISPRRSLYSIPISELHPTQATIGFREVDRKRRQRQRRLQKKPAEAIGFDAVPTVLGPKARHYLLDGHHLARMLHDEGVKEVLTSCVADLSALSKGSFWGFLDNRSWCHPYDASGKRRGFSIIPNTIAELADDPYRSLAGELRRTGGYAKDLAPFSEFLWADYLRSRIDVHVIRHDFEAAVLKAVKLAKSKEAAFLPGWCGPS
jgi:hypothetical protein